MVESKQASDWTKALTLYAGITGMLVGSVGVMLAIAYYICLKMGGDSPLLYFAFGFAVFVIGMVQVVRFALKADKKSKQQ